MSVTLTERILCKNCLRVISLVRNLESSIHILSSSHFSLQDVSHKRNVSLLTVKNQTQRNSVPVKSVNVCYSEETKQRPIAQTTIDEEEREKFTKLSHTWWDELGEFKALHSMNAIRIPWIRDTLTRQSKNLPVSLASPLKDRVILDAGSGGGILTEPLARLGASVIGIDMVEENIKVAQSHLNQDPHIASNVKYIQATVEDLVGTEEETFDAVVSSEVVEHVSDLSTFISSCCKVLKPGGSLFITTMNKTSISYALAVFAAEQVLQIVPKGTHDWNKFIPPEDLQYMLEKNGLTTKLIHGMVYNPLTNRWTWIQDTSINYALHAVKVGQSKV